VKKSDKLLLTVALEKIEASGLVNEGSVDKAMPTYASALGPSFRTLGLVPTLAIYAKDTAGDGAAAKAPLLEVVAKVLSDPRLPLLSPDQRTALGTAKYQLFDWVIAPEQSNNQQRLQRQIETATVATKIAFRTYEIKKA
jgi:hypothetical protein